MQSALVPEKTKYESNSRPLQGETRRISLDWKNGEVSLLRCDKANRKCEEVMVQPLCCQSGLPMAAGIELGVSEPTEGYIGLTAEDGAAVKIGEVGLKLVETGAAVDFAFDEPVDQRIDEDHFEQFLQHDGLRPGYKTVHLQRLANPLNPAVWNGWVDFYAVSSIDPLLFLLWEESRKGNGAFDFANPLRPAKANNLVPLAASAVDPVSCGLFRKGSGADPLFDYDPPTTVPHSDTDRAAYFRYDMRQRLGNLVTTRSSVFAVRISVGYFEVDTDGVLQTDASGRGIEWGASSGQLVRNRGFFLVDCSIPVVFEPGKNHNVDRAVLARR